MPVHSKLNITNSAMKGKVTYEIEWFDDNKYLSNKIIIIAHAKTKQ